MNKKVLSHSLKSVTPPIIYDFFERTYRFLIKCKTDSSHKFSGKVFCIGFNKTGTTSVEQALCDFGYSMGNYTAAAMLMSDWHKGYFERLIQYCRTAQAFQDIPFSLPKTYEYLDAAFPEAKFILTIRNSEKQWYQSLTQYHTKRYSWDKRRFPNEADLMEFSDYPYYGFVLDILKMEFNYPAVDLYDYQHYTELYLQHNRDAIQYFRNRPDKLLVLNVSLPNAYQQLAAFLNVKVSENDVFPWKNKT